MLSIGSLFSGIGGLELGLERAGLGPVKWQVEIDGYCQKVLEKHWPGVRRYSDIFAVDGAELEPVDLICGGFPCQPFSAAGKRKGTADERHLWPEFLRIIREVRPRWVVAENVPGLLSIDSGRVFGSILRDLALCGYRVEWDCISAQSVGAWHRRDRIFITAHWDTDGRNVGEEREIPKRCADTIGISEGNVSDPSSLGRDDRGNHRERGHLHNPEIGKAQEDQSEWNRWEYRLGENHQDVPDPRSRESGQQTERKGRKDSRGRSEEIIIADSEGDDADGLCGKAIPFDDQRDSRLEPQCGRHGFSEREPSQISDPESPEREGGLSARSGRIRLTDLCARNKSNIWAAEPGVGRVADGVPSRVDRLRSLGNAVVPQVAEVIGRAIIEAERRKG